MFEKQAGYRMNDPAKKGRYLLSRLKPAVFPLTLLVIFIGIIALLGYEFETEQVYRPIKFGPATNPLTIVCFLMGGLYLILDNSKFKHHPLKLLPVMVVFFIALLRIIDYYTGSEIMEIVMPYYYQVIDEVDRGKNNAMGLNTGLMFVAFSLALVTKHFEKYRLDKIFSLVAKILSLIALSIPCVALLGYLIEMEKFYGQMSLTTAIMGVTLAVASFASTFRGRE
jgi:asparagine N-glycosylation enzyme membrane subunit Stt3